MRTTLVVASLIAAMLEPLVALAADPPVCGGETATIWGTSGDDVITGTDGRDVIAGLGGHDVIDGGGGDDLICGNGGRDQIDGGPGNDILFGGSGRDALAGGAGDDLAKGGRGVDSAIGDQGIDDCRAESRSSCEVRTLDPGDSGPSVVALQELLASKAFFGHAVDGIFGDSTASAVVAFHKVIDASRVVRFKRAEWPRLLAFTPEVPVARSGEPDRIEVDVTHQVLYLIEGGEVSHILPVSTGGEYLYYSQRQRAWVLAHTPRGDFTLQWRQFGWSCDSVTDWCVYNYWSFTPYYGIHGYDEVPPEPASHGCVRITLWDADMISPKYRQGMPVHIWD